MGNRTPVSRYASATELSVRLPDGSVRKVMGRVANRHPEPAQLHTVKQGDRLDLLAHRYYGDATKWWVIADANTHLWGVDELPSTLLDDDRVGTRISIPYNPTRM